MKRLLFLLVLLASPLLSAENLLVNPAFDGPQGWDPLWTREANTGQAEFTNGVLKATYTGGRDWSVGQSRRVEASPGEVYEFSGGVKVLSGSGEAQLSVVTRDGSDQVLEWNDSVQRASGPGGWQTLGTKFVVPGNCASLQFRITGWGPGTFLFKGPSLTRLKGAPKVAALKGPLSIASASLTIALDPIPQRLHLLTSAGVTFDFDASSLLASVLSWDHPAPDRLDLQLVNPSGPNLRASLWAGPAYATLTLQGGGPLLGDYAFPGPFLSAEGQSWVLPVNEGLMVPSDDPAFQTWDLVLNGGHGLCMPFIGLTDGRASLLVIAETQDDASVHFTPPTGAATSSFTFNWQPSRQSWRYGRVLRLVPVTGGHVALAKAYRNYAEEKGLLVTLREKAKTVPAVDKLVGAVNLWWWGDAPRWSQDDAGALDFAKELKARGVTRVLWSHEQKPDTVEGLNQLGFLTGRYDIYQDVWGPEDPHRWVNHDGWPDDRVLLPDGDFMRGWVDKDGGKEYPGGVICSTRALDWERKKVPADLATHAYGARFLDTTTASPLRECYDKRHPLSRSDDRKNKMALLAYLSRDQKLVTGSETGVDMAVPYLHYFEGMMSLGPYRLPDSGYDLTSYKVPSEEFKTFQLGPKYRIPLFELVYHDCVAVSWYWGDSSNRVPELWDERDLFNALYGTMPLFILDKKSWEENKDRFVKSAKDATAVARATGYSEMTDHQFLTPDHTVQETRFADGTRVWANFGRKAYKVLPGVRVKPRSFEALFPDGASLTP